MADKIICPYTLGGINYKNGFVTSCPQQSDRLCDIQDNSLIPSEVINSEGFRKHRKEMMSGTWSPGCHLCKEAEAINSHSMRQDFDYMLDEVLDLDLYNEQTGEIDFKSVKHIELRFSNSCNMSCLHCSDVYSSGWMSKLKRYTPDDEDRKHKLIQLTREFHKTDTDMDLSISIDIVQMEKIVKDLNDNFPNLIKVDFSGGEVLYQKQFFPCLKLLSAHPNAANIKISFHSNFNARFDPVLLSKLLKPFDRTIIHISVDAGKNIYNYFRTGNWQTLKRNIDIFRRIDKETELGIVCTTSAYQIMDIQNVFESFMELDVNYIDSSIVYTPRYMNPALIGTRFKDYVIKDFEDTRKSLYKERQKRLDNLREYKHRASFRKNKLGEISFNDIDTALKGLDFLEHYTLNNTVTHSEWEAFIAYIRKTDKIWNQNFNEHLVNYKFTGNNIMRIKDV